MSSSILIGYNAVSESTKAASNILIGYNASNTDKALGQAEISSPIIDETTPKLTIATIMRMVAAGLITRDEAAEALGIHRVDEVEGVPKIVEPTGTRKLIIDVDDETGS